jgi:hypothetical protein
VVVVAGCVVLVLAGLAAVVRWGGLTVEPPRAPGPGARGPDDPEERGADDPPPVGLVVRRYLWAVNLAVAAGAGAGIMAAGGVYLLVRRWLPAGRAGGLTYGALLLVLATRARPVIAAWHAPRLRPAGQAVLALAALAALPGFVAAVASILGRGSG